MGERIFYGSNVPAFLTKLWTLVEDPKTDLMIKWDSSGTSFHVCDSAVFAKIVLPNYFKHSNMASFTRQLNMYGFRKVVDLEQGALKADKDITQFFHPYFVKDRPQLLDFIKRKTTPKSEDNKHHSDDIVKVVQDVKEIAGEQEKLNDDLNKLKNENEALWEEITNMRRRHQQQQNIVNKLIQFLVNLIQSNRRVPLKRKMQIAYDVGGNVKAMKYDANSSTTAGPCISEIRDVPSPSSSSGSSSDAHVKSRVESVLSGWNGDVTAPPATTIRSSTRAPGSASSKLLAGASDGLDMISPSVDVNDIPLLDTLHSSTLPLSTPVFDVFDTDGSEAPLTPTNSTHNSESALNTPQPLIRAPNKHPLTDSVDRSRKSFPDQSPAAPLIQLPMSPLIQSPTSSLDQSQTFSLNELRTSSADHSQRRRNDSAGARRANSDMMVAVRDGIIPAKEDFTEHVDSIQLNLDSLQSILSDNIMFDNDFISELFNESTCPTTDSHTSEALNFLSNLDTMEIFNGEDDGKTNYQNSPSTELKSEKQLIPYTTPSTLISMLIDGDETPAAIDPDTYLVDISPSNTCTPHTTES